MDAQTIGWLYRINDDNFAFTIGDPNRVTIQCDIMLNRGDDRGHLKFYLSGANGLNNSARIGFNGPNFEYREALHGVKTEVPRTFDDPENGLDDWYRLKLDMDFDSNLATVSYKNLTDGDTEFLPIPRLTDVQLVKAGEKSDPLSWDRLVIRTNYDVVEDPHKRQIGNLVVSSGDSKSGDGKLTSDRAKSTPIKLVTVGDSKTNENDTAEHIITKDLEDQHGAVWSEQKIDFSQHFKINAEIYLGDKEDGADGLALVFQAKDNQIVSTGSGIGYQGISPSIAIEFDTYQNRDENNDPVEDHVGLRIDGDPIHTGSDYVEVGNLEDGKYHPITFEWNASQQTFNLTLDGKQIFKENDDS